MANDCRECRKFGEKLFLKGDKCLSPKCILTRRTNAPGAAPAKGKSQSRRVKKSEYGLQLNEKQKVKKEYGLRERQLRIVFKNAAKMKEATGEVMLQALENRFDNAVFRLGWAKSRSQARQMVTHGHINLNGKKVNIPSLQLHVGDKIEPVNKDKVKETIDEKQQIPSWIKMDKKTLVGEVVGLPSREQIDVPIDEQLVVEYYSR